MSKSVNKVVLLGNVGRDPEISFSAGGAIANLSLATNERRKVSEKWEDFAEWHNVVFFGRAAEIVREYVRKGSKILIEGRLRTRSWDGKDGVRRYKTEIVAQDLVLISGCGDGEKHAPAAETQYSGDF